MVRPAKGKNGGVFIDILSRTNEVDYFKILLVQKYLTLLYEYSFYFMYKTYRLLKRDEQKKYMTSNIKDRDDDIISLFNRDVYDYRKFVFKNVPVIENSTVYHESIYIMPESIQKWIKYRVIWYAGMDCYNMLPDFESWKLSSNVTPNTLKNKVSVFLNLEHAEYKNRSFSPRFNESYIPQMQMKTDEIKRYMHHIDPEPKYIDDINNTLLFKPLSIGKYIMPVIGAELIAYLKRDVDELWRYINQCEYKLFHINIKPYVDKDYINYCLPKNDTAYYNVDIFPENRLTRFVMLNMHLIPKNKNNDIRTLMYKPNKMRELEDRYLEQKGREFNAINKKIPGYYG